eukprot:TRINITY_DN72919_c0_g1_i1.p1 TRINITY_DN72919_c0_g1~~TRINITY_DN72919_c0_g1_i1.p1  ORF type:complete len:247 (-),score=58.01 TRINITY_DN72919_c0_g1_i1:21-761(-)
MGFRKERGQFCLVFPLKFGVALICGLTVFLGLVSLFALLTGDARLKSNGYDSRLVNLPPVVGVFGLPFGVLGLLGVYDDQRTQLRLLRNYLFVKLFVSLLVVVADLRALGGCESASRSGNAQLFALSEAGVCAWARQIYALGCAVDLSLSLYCACCVYGYTRHLELDTSYELNFDKGQGYNNEARWKRYKVIPPEPWNPQAAEAARYAGRSVEEHGGASGGASELLLRPPLVGWGYYGSAANEAAP